MGYTGPQLNQAETLNYTVVASSVALGVAVRRLVQANASRVTLVLGGSSATMFVSTRSGVAVNAGIALAVGQPPLVLTWADHGGLVTAAWFGIAAIGVNIEVVEQFFAPVNLSRRDMETSHAEDGYLGAADRSTGSILDAARRPIPAPFGLAVAQRDYQSLYDRLWHRRYPGPGDHDPAWDTAAQTDR